MTRRQRSIAGIIEPEPVVEGAGVRLKRTIGTRALRELDPFLLLDHFASTRPEDYRAGFPMHPHRGIETVTYVLAGEVRHRDSLGNAGSIGPGDVQWMTAGGGILHEEMPQVRPEGIAGFQLWVNLPAARKLSRPRYRDLRSGAIPEVRAEGGATIRVIAGTAGGATGPIAGIAVEPTYLDVRLPAQGRFSHPVPQGQAAFAYLFEGDATFTEDGGAGAPVVAAPRLVILGDGDEVAMVAGARGARFLLVSGRPLGEPIARHGPFVMNTQEEIRQALADLERGTFVWSEHGQAAGDRTRG